MPNNFCISNDISLHEHISAISKEYDVSSSDNSSVENIPRMFLSDDVIANATVSSGDIRLLFHIFNVDCDPNNEDEHFIDDNLPFTDYVSIVTPVLEPHYHDDQDALVVCFYPTENRKQSIKPITFLLAL